MDVLRKGQHFIDILEHKQHRLKISLSKVKLRIHEIKKELADLRSQHDHLNQRIDSLTPSGLLIRCELYKGIRQQGALISYQQLVIHKITTLEKKLLTENVKLAELNMQMVVINKKHYKVARFLNELKHTRIRSEDNNLENEIQELSVYGKKYD